MYAIRSYYVNNDIVAEARVKIGGHDLTVGGGENRIAGAIRGNVYALVNVPLPGKGMLVLAELHGNVADSALDGPKARYVRKEGALGVQELPDFLNGLNRISYNFV